MLRKVVYPYKYFDSWKKCYETLLPDKETFYSNLNITLLNADYKNAKNYGKTWK